MYCFDVLVLDGVVFRGERQERVCPLLCYRTSIFKKEQEEHSTRVSVIKPGAKISLKHDIKVRIAG